jgi:hypothetical protein
MAARFLALFHTEVGLLGVPRADSRPDFRPEGSVARDASVTCSLCAARVGTINKLYSGSLQCLRPELLESHRIMVRGNGYGDAESRSGS